MAKVLTVEKKGGAVFYTIGYDNKEVGRISGNDLRLTIVPITADDIRSLILLMGSQQPGKPWQINEIYKKEFGVKDKLAPIFCASQSKRSNKGAIKRELDKDATDNNSDSDVPLSEFVGRRSGVALPPNASFKEVDKKTRMLEKKQHKEKQRKAKEVKKDLKSSAQNSSFLTPQKRSERRFCSAVRKLQDAWCKRDEQVSCIDLYYFSNSIYFLRSFCLLLFGAQKSFLVFKSTGFRTNAIDLLFEKFTIKPKML
ncbi:hypothetical protein DICVIV_04994 [Dictyocaulus viviparus]|uniref:Uncharacterized protein n=1 Tax=Dictyocaulus viviparus TaxID=29172 RepID=A0A0D8XW59_DICVI|nr:hypothetical protein DICVIV_04994 [Dictyocaulus viviparus]